MDPYLEHPQYFHGFHNAFIIHLQELLQARLPAGYYAQNGQRIWLERLERSIEPDVNLMRGRELAGRIADRGGIAVAEPVVRDETEAGQPVLITVRRSAPWEHAEWFLEIRELTSGQHRLVATIEVVSPANKTPSHQAFDKYRRKQHAVIASKAHLVEIDLLRKGTHVTAVPRALARDKAGPYDYHVSIHRFDRPKDFLVYPIRLEQRLPVLAIPLLPGDPDVPLDLQAAFDRAYDGGPYRRAIRYGEDPIKPALRPEQARWAESILKPSEAEGSGRPHE
jgi:hypothetical protein